ncbi:MAG: CBS domain-containing protein [Anaerolineales bacterium]
MNIESVMTRDVAVLGPNDTVRSAAETMKRLDIGSTPVCNGRTLVGMITDRDIALRVVAEGRNPLNTTVEQVMTRDVVYCFADQDVQEVADAMAASQVRRMPILNRQHELVGIVSLGDLAVDVADDEMSGEVLEEVSQPSQPQS